MKVVATRFCESGYPSLTKTIPRLWLLLMLVLSAPVFAQYNVPEKPKTQSYDRWVYDEINLFNESQQQSLARKFIRYADTTSTQIVVAIVSTTKGEDISLLGAKWGQAWGIGQSKEDNGILIVLAKDDRQVDINTGYGIETIITDRDAERVINRIMIPQFKNGNFYQGLDQGTTALMQMLAGQYQGTPQRNDFPIEPIIMFIIFIVILIILSRNNRGGRGNGRSGSLLDVIILSNMGRGGFGGGSGSFGGGSFGGGGFGGGFGGGGFGGGGASGGW